MKLTPKVSFIIPVLYLQRPRNKKRFFMPRSTLSELLDDIHRNVTVDFEVIVICNSMDDDLIQFVKNHALVTKYILNSVNPGVPRSWNMGAQLSEGEYLCYASDDVRIGKSSIESLCEALDEDPLVGEVGPKGDLYKNGRPDRFVGTKIPEDSDVISGFLFLVRSSVYFQVGGFDIAYSPAGCEEVDFSFAVRKAGWRCRVIPHLDIFHNQYHGVSAHRTQIRYLDSQIDTLELHERNTKYFLAKWGFSK
jgi:GT2 family glycosyltransferase